MPQHSEAFSRILIDKELEFSGWDLLDHNQVTFEYHNASGRGIGTALTWHGLAQACKDGFEICYTDWISPILPASRFWPRFGLKDAAYRLSKRVNPMIAWTKG